MEWGAQMRPDLRRLAQPLAQQGCSPRRQMDTGRSDVVGGGGGKDLQPLAVVFVPDSRGRVATPVVKAAAKGTAERCWSRFKPKPAS